MRFFIFLAVLWASSVPNEYWTHDFDTLDSPLEFESGLELGFECSFDDSKSMVVDESPQVLSLESGINADSGEGYCRTFNMEDIMDEAKFNTIKQFQPVNVHPQIHLKVFKYVLYKHVLLAIQKILKLLNLSLNTLSLDQVVHRIQQTSIAYISKALKDQNASTVLHQHFIGKATSNILLEDIYVLAIVSCDVVFQSVEIVYDRFVSRLSDKAFFDYVLKMVQERNELLAEKERNTSLPRMSLINNGNGCYINSAVSLVQRINHFDVLFQSMTQTSFQQVAAMIEGKEDDASLFLAYARFLVSFDLYQAIGTDESRNKLNISTVQLHSMIRSRLSYPILTQGDANQVLKLLIDALSNIFTRLSLNTSSFISFQTSNGICRITRNSVACHLQPQIYSENFLQVPVFSQQDSDLFAHLYYNGMMNVQDYFGFVSVSELVTRLQEEQLLTDFEAEIGVTEAYHKFSLLSSPQTLVIGLNRCVNFFDQQFHLFTPIDVLSLTINQNEYSLLGAILFSNNETFSDGQSGHYYTVWRQSDHWILYDDMQPHTRLVSNYETEPLLRTNSYSLVYELQSDSDAPAKVGVVLEEVEQTGVFLTAWNQKTLVPKRCLSEFNLNCSSDLVVTKEEVDDIVWNSFIDIITFKDDIYDKLLLQSKSELLLILRLTTTTRLKRKFPLWEIDSIYVEGLLNGQDNEVKFKELIVYFILVSFGFFTKFADFETILSQISDPTLLALVNRLE